MPISVKDYIDRQASLDTPRLRQALKMWIEDRALRKKQLTEHAVRLQANNLARVSEDEAVRMIETAINNGWQGLFAPKKAEQTQTRRRVRASDLRKGSGE